MTTPAELAALPSAQLIPPLNAARAGNAAPGVQPGVSGQIVFAQYVVVFGTSGGMFIYAGQPGPGNPPVYWFGNVVADPYGNPLKQGVWAGQQGSIQVGIQTSGPGAGGSAQIFFVPVGDYAADATAGMLQTGGQAFLEFLGAQTTANPDAESDRVGLFLTDHGSGQSAALSVFYFDSAGAGHVALGVTCSGLQLPAVWGLSAVQPGTGSSSANPYVPETWHPAALSNSWAGSGSGVNGLFYRLNPDAEVEIILDLLHATATGNSICATLGTGYRPATAINLPLAWNNPQASNSASPPWLNVSTGGALQITGIETANKEIFGRVKFPLGSL